MNRSKLNGCGGVYGEILEISSKAEVSVVNFTLKWILGKEQQERIIAEYIAVMFELSVI